MRRLLFTLASLISLILCVLAVGMSLRRTYQSDRWTWGSFRPATDATRPELRQCHVLVSGGGLRLQRYVFSIENRDYHPARHELELFHEVGGGSRRYPPLWDSLPTSPYPRKAKAYADLAGFAFGTVAWDPPMQSWRVWSLTIPLWGLAAVLAVPPFLWELRYRRMLRRFWRIRGGLCANCGYDLRATSDRCPECGTEAAAAN